MPLTPRADGTLRCARAEATGLATYQGLRGRQFVAPTPAKSGNYADPRKPLYILDDDATLRSSCSRVKQRS